MLNYEKKMDCLGERGFGREKTSVLMPKPKTSVVSEFSPDVATVC